MSEKSPLSSRYLHSGIVTLTTGHGAQEFLLVFLRLSEVLCHDVSSHAEAHSYTRGIRIGLNHLVNHCTKLLSTTCNRDPLSVLTHYTHLLSTDTLCTVCQTKLLSITHYDAQKDNYQQLLAEVSLTYVTTSNLKGPTNLSFSHICKGSFQYFILE